MAVGSAGTGAAARNACGRDARNASRNPSRNAPACAAIRPSHTIDLIYVYDEDGSEVDEDGAPLEFSTSRHGAGQ